MIDVVFSDVDAGNIFTLKKRGILPPTPGTDDLINLPFMLDIGHLSGGICSKYRKGIPQLMYSQSIRDFDFEKSRDFLKIGTHTLDQWRKLKEYIKLGASIRIWYGTAPYSLCGFYHVCSFLKRYDTPAYTMELPLYSKKNGVVTDFVSWAEIEIENLEDYLTLERLLSHQEIEMYAKKWRALVREDAPLRALINGQLTSVPEDFYDFAIFRFLPENESVKEVDIIEKILGTYHFGVMDCWFARRIQEYIRQGVLTVVEDCENTYRRVIRRE